MFSTAVFSLCLGRLPRPDSDMRSPYRHSRDVFEYVHEDFRGFGVVSATEPVNTCFSEEGGLDVVISQTTIHLIRLQRDRIIRMRMECSVDFSARNHPLKRRPRR